MSQHTKQEWISVKERLPQIPEPYFDYEWGGMVTPINIDLIVWDGENVFQKSFGIIAWGPEITHWMYLPEPPKTNQS